MSSGRATGIWISANSASVLCWNGGVSVLHRVVSSVPGRHRSTGRPPTQAQPAAEGHRDEHMRSYFAEVARVVPDEDDLLLIGDGEVVDHFADHMRTLDSRYGRSRRLVVQQGGPLTDPQLLASVRAFVGLPARRTRPRA